MFKNISHLAQFPAGSRQAAKGAGICETSLLLMRSLILMLIKLISVGKRGHKLGLSKQLMRSKYQAT